MIWLRDRTGIDVAEIHALGERAVRGGSAPAGNYVLGSRAWEPPVASR